MVYAQHLKCCVLKNMRVRLPPRPPLGNSSVFWKPKCEDALRAAESVGQKSESLILVQLYDKVRTFFERNS